MFDFVHDFILEMILKSSKVKNSNFFGKKHDFFHDFIAQKWSDGVARKGNRNLDFVSVYSPSSLLPRDHRHHGAVTLAIMWNRVFKISFLKKYFMTYFLTKNFLFHFATDIWTYSFFRAVCRRIFQKVLYYYWR